MIRTFWLSFVGDDGKNRGACVIDVDEHAAAFALVEIRARFPKARPGAEWLGAAMRKAWQYGCNPGGQVASWEMPANLPADEQPPRNRLLVGDELAKWGFKRGS